ncbi:flagellar brake protein [Alteromonadaceae bacterium M269]|nr:flagellar brake protein [Alteromonadaceae bacterium M269]
MEQGSRIVDVESSFPLADHLHMGQVVDVEIQNMSRDRFYTRLVGCKDGQFILLEQPDVNKYGYVRDKLEDSTVLIIRTIFEKTSGEACGFKSFVLSKLNHPARLFFVKFPQEIESKELRREGRVSAKIPAKIYHTQQTEDDQKIEGYIANISSGGCCFKCEVKESIKRVKTETLYIDYEEEGNWVSATTVVKSQRKDKNTLTLGLAFIK